MYKDKDRQREANKEAMRRKRAKVSQVGITDHNTDGDSVTLKEGMTQGVTDKALPDDFEEEFVEIPTSPRCITKPKRGKDIKCFADLPPNVRRTIDRTSESEQEHKRRTAIAVDYQHKHPDRYHSTGAVFTGSMTVMERLFYRPGQRNFVSLPGRACHGVY